MKLRESTTDENDAVVRLHRDVFAASEGAEEGEVIRELVQNLLNDASAEPRLSLVAEDNGSLVGSALFTRVTVDDQQGLILAPLAVGSGRQRGGVGLALMKEGLGILQDRGTPFVLVLGDPKYYTKAGFAAGHNIKPPYELPYPEAWMAIELQSGALDNISGTAVCADSLMPREYW